MMSKTPLSYHFYLLAVVVNIALTSVIFIHPEPINIDGILYLHVAQVYLQQGFHAALQIYPWPFYAIIIAKTSQFIHITLFDSAILCNSLLTSLMLVYAMRIVPYLGGNRRHQFWMCVVLLLYPFLNLDRFFIVRDFGYYALYVASLFYFLKFLMTEKITDGLSWQMSLLLATLFRIEGIILLGLIPIIYFVMTSTKKRWTTCIYNTIKLTIILLCLAPVVFIFYSHGLNASKLAEIQTYIDIPSLKNSFHDKLVIIQDKILGVLGNDNGVPFLIGGLVGVFILTLLQTLGICYALLMIIGLYQKTSENEITHSSKQGMFMYCLAVTIILLGFMCHMFFLSDRYMMPLSLLLIIMLPFIIEHIWQNGWIGKLLIGCVFIYNSIASFGHFGHSKNYIVNAGHWIQQYQITQKHFYPVYTSDPQLAFYANTIPTSAPKNLDALMLNHGILVIKIRSHQNSPLNTNIPPTKIFENKSGDKALIYVFPTDARDYKIGTSSP